MMMKAADDDEADEQDVITMFLHADALSDW